MNFPEDKDFKQHRIQVAQIQRRPTETQFSVENYFSALQPRLSESVGLKQHLVPSLSKGLFGRLRNMLFARRHQADVTHVTGDIHYCTLLLRRRTTILTVLDCQILSRLSGWRRILVKWLWFTLPAKRCRRMTAISEETKRTLSCEIDFPADRIHVIPVCVDDRFIPHPRPFNAARPRVLQIGTKANKNVPRLIQALSGLNVELDLVGPIDTEIEKELQASEIPFRAWGRLSDSEILERYQVADIVSFVSTHEGFGMPIIEAQCVERVCVTSNCSSMPEVAGAGACLVNPLDVASIRAGFERVIADADYRENLLAAGRVNRNRFQAAVIAQQYTQLYRQVYDER